MSVTPSTHPQTRDPHHGRAGPSTLVFRTQTSTAPAAPPSRERRTAPGGARTAAAAPVPDSALTGYVASFTRERENTETGGLFTPCILRQSRTVLNDAHHTGTSYRHVDSLASNFRAASNRGPSVESVTRHSCYMRAHGTPCTRVIPWGTLGVEGRKGHGARLCRIHRWSRGHSASASETRQGASAVLDSHRFEWRTLGAQLSGRILGGPSTC